MYSLRILVALATGLTATSLLFFIALSPGADGNEAQQSPPTSRHSTAARFSFTSPGSLFPPSAIISLTDDNSTFFLARPAAFGPDLSADGLSSPLWAGNEFTDDGSRKAELGCSDVPDWEDEEEATSLNASPHDISAEPELRGRIALLRRGGCGFLPKVLWAQKRGAVAVIVGDDVRGGGLVRMYAKGDTSDVVIPSLFTSYTTAHILSSLLEPRKTIQKDQHTHDQFDSRLPHHGKDLWVTLTPTNISTSPFFDTLLVLVVSPLVTLTVVYALLLLRSRIRRRRWRAPKSLVERLPVRTYEAISGTSSSTASLSSSPRAPLLQPAPSDGMAQDLGTMSSEDPEAQTRSDERNMRAQEVEKRESGLAEWRRRYGGRQKECVICLEEYVNGVSQVMRLPCGHEFHADCITPWLVTRRRICPICKGDVVRSLAQSFHERTPSQSPTRSASAASDAAASQSPAVDGASSLTPEGLTARLNEARVLAEADTEVDTSTDNDRVDTTASSRSPRYTD